MVMFYNCEKKHILFSIKILNTKTLLGDLLTFLGYDDFLKSVIR